VIEIPFRTYRRLRPECMPGDTVFWFSCGKLRLGVLEKFWLNPETQASTAVVNVLEFYGYRYWWMTCTTNAHRFP